LKKRKKRNKWGDLLNRAIFEAQQIAYSYPQGDDYNPVLVITELIMQDRIKLKPFDFGTDKISGMLTKYDGSYIISVNLIHPAKRKYFTIAHELGHYHLHKNKSTIFSCGDLFQEQNTHMETEANTFAAELLMPIETFRIFLSRGMSLKEISRKLIVSYDAVCWRYINLCNMLVPDFNAERKQKLIDLLFDKRKIVS
jgi:Zn-dependent peptidase ImmA (M78 family)